MSQSYQHFHTQPVSGSYKRTNDVGMKTKSSKEKIKNPYKTDNSIIMNKKELNRELNLKPNLVNKIKESNINSNKSTTFSFSNSNSNSKLNSSTEINNAHGSNSSLHSSKVNTGNLKKTSSNHTNHSSLMNERRNSASSHHNQQEKFLGYDTQFLADILSPKSALCDQKFQLTINNLTFVGHPTLINSESTSNKNSILNRYLKKGIDKNKNNNVNNNSNSNINQFSGSKSDKMNNNNRYAHLMPSSPVSSHYNSLDNESVNSEDEDTNSPNYLKNDATNLTMFHVVFIIRPSDDKSFDNEIDKLYNNVILKLSHGLQHEQRYRSYVMKQTDLILSLKDESYEDSNQLMDCILYRSSLARDLATIYDSLISDRIAHVVINNSVDLSLQIPPMLPSLDDNEEYLLSDEQILSNDTSFPTLRPYHALLLLEDPEEILKSFPKDPSPTLVELIQVVTPMQCFEELQSILDCSLSHIYKLAAHLVYWRKARIIDVISIRNVYVISPNADLDT